MEGCKTSVQQCVAELSDLGYRPFQIKKIIRETVNTAHLQHLSQEEERQLVDTLNEYIGFAKRCLQR